MTFGQAQGRYAAASGVGQAEVDAILRHAVDAGANFIDTADVYANGQSEEIIGQAIRSLGLPRKDLVIATKFEHATGPGPNDGGGSRHHVIAAAESSLRRLAVDHIDLYQMHGWDPATPVEETLRALDDLVRRGLVRYVGVSNWAAWQVVRALGTSERLNLTRFQTYQGYYSLAGRDLEREIGPMLTAEGLGLLVYSPLAGGFLTGKYREGRNGSGGRRTTIPFPPVDETRGRNALAAIDTVAAARGVSMEAVALAWLTHRPGVTSIILGVKRLDQLKANLEAVKLKLDAAELRQLDEASAMPPEYPGWMIANASAPRQTLLETGSVPVQH
jgi:aryl-alcohol dehydrogenase-like predicted oxidoreductase